MAWPTNLQKLLFIEMYDAMLCTLENVKNVQQAGTVTHTFHTHQAAAGKDITNRPK